MTNSIENMENERNADVYTFAVAITETLKRIVEVKASSPEEAEQIVSDNWDDSEYVLDADDFTDVAFAVDDEKSEISKFKLEIIQDDDASSPRGWDNLGKMVCWHRRYKLGDEHNFDNSEEFFQDLVRENSPAKELVEFVKSGKAKNLRFETDEDGVTSLMGLWISDNSWYSLYDLEGATEENSNDGYLADKIIDELSISDLRKFAERTNLILPLYLYDHSGITMSTAPFSYSWDSGQVGYIYVSHKKIIEEYGEVTPKDIERAEGILKSEVEIYDCYLRGESYGYQLSRGGDVVDSCWGFLGDFDTAKEDISTHLPEKASELINNMTYDNPIIEYYDYNKAA